MSGRGAMWMADTMVELLQAAIRVDGREGMRCYCVSLLWSSGVSQSYVVFETEFPRAAKRIQATMDATKDMNVTERLRYIQGNLGWRK